MPQLQYAFDRRGFLRVGITGVVGATVPWAGSQLRGSNDLSSEVGKGKAKSVLIVFLNGGPSQLDTLDPKPNAPSEVRGEFAPIATTIPGVMVCEHLPRLAKQMDRWAMIRTLAHKEHNHLLATHVALTGRPTPLPRGGTDLDRVESRSDFPNFAAALDFVRPRTDGIPSGVSLPNYFPRMKCALRMRSVLLVFVLTLYVQQTVWSQTVVRSIEPKSYVPGATAKLKLLGDTLPPDLRVLSSYADAKLVIESVQPDHAILEMNLPARAPFGPIGLWFATAEGVLPPLIMMVDDLPEVADNGANHDIEHSQTISAFCAVDGTCEGPVKDYYRFRAEAGQRISFEIQTQSLDSKMDPLLRLLDASGKLIRVEDDDQVGPECRFGYQFTDAGDYLIEVSDSHYEAGGTYHLRIGDFPILDHAFPLAIQKGHPTEVTIVGIDDACEGPTKISPILIDVSSDTVQREITVATRFVAGKNSTWRVLVLSDLPQCVETATNELIQLPAAINGQLAQAAERDSYLIQGKAGQLFRIASKTRSLGCATRLKMKMFNSAQVMVAESPVTEADEWSFDYTFPDNEVYRLEVADLLKRGGKGFGYFIEMTAAGSFAVSMKADAKVREMFDVEAAQGGFAVDLQIARFGYDGEIHLSLPEAISGLRILNSKIPASVTEFRAIVLADANWKGDEFKSILIKAQAVTDPKIVCNVDNYKLHRLKEPHLLFQKPWNSDKVILAGVASSGVLFNLEPAAPIQLARTIASQSISMQLKRIQQDFKEGVTVYGSLLPPGWTVVTTAENDNYKLALSRAAIDSNQPSELSLLVLAEHKNRLRWETIKLPIEWIDPVQISFDAIEGLIAGTKQTIGFTIQRKGNDPQPLSVKITGLPAGITGPTEPIVVAADQSSFAIDLQISQDLLGDSAGKEGQTISIEATTQYMGAELKVLVHSWPLVTIARPQSLEVYPAKVELDGVRARQQVVVTGLHDCGMTRDWTNEMRMSIADPTIAVARNGVVFPLANGATELVLELGTMRQAVPIEVKSFEVKRPIGFESEVLVALSKQGCNSGACHGSPSGKGNFRLSLRAFDKKLDELTLIREDFGRRINAVEPAESLLLLKPLMKVTHGGGKQIDKSDVAYSILHDWIAEGFKRDPKETPRCVHLDVYPRQKRMMKRITGGQQFAATARFSDGTQRDVTHLVAYETSNADVATVDKLGRVTAHRRGEAVILVRFLEHIESVPLMFIDTVPGFQWDAPTPNSNIDELVNAKLQQLQYLPSATCADSEFLRRVYLDVIGVLPTVLETKAFLDDPDQGKRARLIDQLLERDEYPRFWALKWGDLLRMTSKRLGSDGVFKYHRWVEAAIRNNMPYDQFARQLLTASGSTLEQPSANFYRTSIDMNECVETVSQVFLGARLQCAKCHNHPFERWTQDNYFGLGAFFNRIQRKATQRPGELFVWLESSGEVTQPRTGEVMKPWLPKVGSIEVTNDEDRRESFARWLVDRDNPYFAKMEANRIWSHLFARGIVDPIDDFRDSNPPSNEALLDALAKDFIEGGFDRKALVRKILNSRTYQSSTQTNQYNVEDQLYFSHQQSRLISAEQLLDAINHVAQLNQVYTGLPAETKATQLPAPDITKVDFLKVLGQPERSTVCACERVSESNLGMAIELFNGPLVHDKLRDANNRFRKLIAEGKAIEEVIRELYLAAYCRQPTEAEFSSSITYCKQRKDLAYGCEDLCWAILNSDEFLFQH